MSKTLAQARTTVLDHLDDELGDRWNTSQVDTGLRFALNLCQNDYVSGGGERFSLLLNLNSTSSGALDLSAQNPVSIKQVSVKSGERFWPIKPIDLADRNYNDNTVREIQVSYVPEFVLPTNTAHPLVGSGATAYRSWEVFDDWVCVQAAMFCSVKDDELRQSLQALEATLRASVMMHERIPSASPFLRRKLWISEWLKWYWDPSQRAIQIVRS
jgi:hypothetical protein